MDAIDLLVLRTLAEWRSAGDAALLATVVRTWGSSPRPRGAMMALRADGRSVGSVSGGCIEDDLVARHRGAIAARAPQLVRYGAEADEARRFGLPCGGTLELLLEFMPDAAGLRELVRRLDAGELVRRIVARASGAATIEAASAPKQLTLDDAQLVATLGPGWRMLLIGAGELANYLATMARFCGFAVVVCEPRAEVLAGRSLDGVQVTDAMPDDAVAAFSPDARSCVIALSHDPKLDDLALLEALNTPAAYIGAIGSRRNAAARRARMAAHFGATDDALGRLRSPVGVDIGSKTPPEIAVSVMAEVLAVKNGTPAVGSQVASKMPATGC